MIKITRPFVSGSLPRIVFYALLFFSGLSTSIFGQVLSIKSLSCENSVNPVGLSVTNPELGWQLASGERNVQQLAYEIRVSEGGIRTSKKNGITWRSGKILSAQSVHVVYSGSPLQSSKKYDWQVRVWDNHGNVSGWSEPSHWQMGLLNTADWKAKWIQPGYKEDSVLRPCPMFRKEFNAGKTIQSATAFITSHGVYEAFINGVRIGNASLTPGWTSYNKRLQYQVYDVSSLLEKGSNAVGVTLASGWYRSHLGWEMKKDVFGKDLALLFQLQISYSDGSTAVIVSDGSWKSTAGAFRSAENYAGEIYDARMEKDGWNKPAFDAHDWWPVSEQHFDVSNLAATANEQIKEHEIFNPLKIIRTPSGELVVDFGQNLVGRARLKVKGTAGDTINVYHAEVLDKAGNFYTENLRAARQQNTYILKGGVTETFEPHFTFQGFRYVKIVGYPGQLQPGDISATALYSDMPATGSFTTSNPLLNQLQHNIQWGQRGNFLDVPTDCPQRDERLGWTGDAQVFAPTAAFNMQVNNFFAKWMKDLAADQLPNGSVPWVIPNVLDGSAAGAAGWADAATIIPWDMYLSYGDKRILEQQYPSMKAWVGYMQQNSKNDLWNTGFHFGDWLFYSLNDDRDGQSAITDKYLIAQCFYAHSVQIMINTAGVLDKKDDINRYTALLQKIKSAFIKEYLTPNGRLVSGTQTAYTLALHFDMLPESLRPAAAQRLAENIKAYNNHLTTGFLGTPYLCHVLTRFGYNDIAYGLLLQETYPSWLYPVKMGATTIWERWDGQKPDGSFQNPGMNSFNHYAYGAIGDWMYRTIGGISTSVESPGYSKSVIKPLIGGGLTWAATDLETSYGKISSHWKLDNGSLAMDVEIPANTSAMVYIPAKDAGTVMESGKPLSSVTDLKIQGIDGGFVKAELGSGKYHFTVH